MQRTVDFFRQKMFGPSDSIIIIRIPTVQKHQETPTFIGNSNTQSHLLNFKNVDSIFHNNLDIRKFSFPLPCFRQSDGIFEIVGHFQSRKSQVNLPSLPF